MKDPEIFQTYLFATLLGEYNTIEGHRLICSFLYPIHIGSETGRAHDGLSFAGITYTGDSRFDFDKVESFPCSCKFTSLNLLNISDK